MIAGLGRVLGSVENSSHIYILVSVLYPGPFPGMSRSLFWRCSVRKADWLLSAVFLPLEKSPFAPSSLTQRNVDLERFVVFFLVVSLMTVKCPEA